MATQNVIQISQLPEITQSVSSSVDPGHVAVKEEFVLKRKIEEDSEVGKKGKKARGQNKHRPRHTRESPHQRLCRSTIRGNICTSVAKCKFLHSVDEYLSKKPPDIGDKCVFYERDGVCPYGVTCRFRKGHSQIHPEIEQFKKHPNYNFLYSQIRKNQIQLPRSEKYLLTMDVSKELGVSLELHNSKVDNCNKTDPLVCNQPDTSAETSAFSAQEVREEGKKLDFRGKLYLAPLTTVGNFPFRRICSEFGAEIMCGEMAMATSLMQGLQQEWSLIEKSDTCNWKGKSNSIVGAQLCGSYPDTMTRCAELISKCCEVDFIDVNLGCPIDLVCNKGAGAALMERPTRLSSIIQGMRSVLDIPLTVKLRTGMEEGKYSAHKIIPLLKEWGVDAIALHGRSRAQRYTKLADWDYIAECARIADPVPLIGCGDIFSSEDYYRCLQTGVSGCMIARGALIKPWIFTEIREHRIWDISSQERFEMLLRYSSYGLERWGSDTDGVEKTRRFLLEWLSFLYRYIPVGLLERVQQRMNDRHPTYHGRDDLETLMASNRSGDWVKLSSMLLGPPPENFLFLPKHKANAYTD